MMPGEFCDKDCKQATKYFAGKHSPACHARFQQSLNDIALRREIEKWAAEEYTFSG